MIIIIIILQRSCRMTRTPLRAYNSRKSQEGYFGELNSSSAFLHIKAFTSGVALPADASSLSSVPFRWSKGGFLDYNPDNFSFPYIVLR